MVGGIAVLSLLCSMLMACGGGVEADSPPSNSSGTASSGATVPGTATLAGTSAPDTATSGTTTPGTTTPVATTSRTTTSSTTTPANSSSLPFGNLVKTFGDSPFQFSPPSSSGGAFSLTSSNPAVAFASGSTVTIVGAGTSTITATQVATGGGSQTTKATLIVNKAQPALLLPTVTLKALSSDAVPLRASTSSNGLVGYVLSNMAVSGGANGTVATLSRSGGQTFIRTSYSGTAMITATQVPTANYAGATVSAALVVEKADSATLTLTTISTR